MTPPVPEIRDGFSGIDGVAVGHGDDPVGLTGCTVVLLPRASPYAVHVSGGASSFRQVAGLVPGHSVAVADAILVTGGSAYGLDAAGGVLAWLEARGRGRAVGAMRVPAVPTVALYDLGIGDPRARPDAAMGRAACEAASGEFVAEGRVGAGMGATVGKVLGVERASRGGLGAASVKMRGGGTVCALAVVNAFGNVVDPWRGDVLAGCRGEDNTFVDAESLILDGVLSGRFRESREENTTIGVVVTDVALDRDGCGRAAVIASQALPLCIRPCQTAVDGDLVSVVSTGTVRGEVHAVGIAGRMALSRAILRAVT